jgi:DNA-binding MarR family transcriptional regulator
MSNAAKRTPRGRARPAPAPLIGSLLRLPHEVVEARMLADLHAHGFRLTLTELRVFLYPGPDGRRPADLARQCDMTRQAMNYVLAGLEQRGYLERRTESASRVVRMTGAGRRLVARLRACVAGIEREWAAHLGRQRFDALRATLHELACWLGKRDGHDHAKWWGSGSDGPGAAYPAASADAQPAGNSRPTPAVSARAAGAVARAAARPGRRRGTSSTT